MCLYARDVVGREGETEVKGDRRSGGCCGLREDLSLDE